MNSKDLKQWLEDQQASFPERATGEEFYAFMIRQAGSVLPDHRAELVQALREWIASRSVPRTDLALQISAKYHLHELAPDAKQLLSDVNRGLYSRPYYAKLVEKLLEQICKSRPTP